MLQLYTVSLRNNRRLMKPTKSTILFALTTYFFTQPFGLNERGSMSYSKLGKVTSTVSLVALLATVGMSSAQAASPPVLVAMNANVGVSSSIKMTPHIHEKTITKQPLGPKDSGLCGEAGLVPIIPEDTIEVHYELRRDRVNAVANPGYAFDPALNLQTEWILNPPYFSCPNPVVPSADIFIVQIDVPTFGRECDPADKQIVLSDTTDKHYYYYIQDGKVIAKEKTTDHIIQQDTPKEWPIVLSTEPCEDALPPVVQPAPPAVEVPDVPVEENLVPSTPVTETETEVEAAPIQAAATTVADSTSSVPAGIAAAASAEQSSVLADTGMNWLAFGLCLIALSTGTAAILWGRGYFARG